MLSYFLGQMVMTIYNQIYGTSSVMTLLNRYSQITDEAMEMDVFSSMVLTIKSVAAGIAVLTYLIDLSGKVTEKNFTIQQFFSSTLRLIVCYLFIMYSDVIVGYLMDIGAAASQGIADTDMGYDFFSIADNKEKLINGIAKMKVTEILGFILSSVIPWVISMIGQVILQVILITRILEIVVMTALAPLSISDIYRSGTSSPGVHYMKKMLALGLQVAVIIMINIATQAIVTEIVGTGAGQTMTDTLITTSISDDAATAEYVFTIDSISTFINNVTGKGAVLKVLGIMLARIGLIWNSLSLCEEITGAK